MSKRINLFTILGIMGILLFSFPKKAYTETTKSESQKKFGIGFQAAPFPIFGLSLNYNLNEKFCLQSIGQIGIDVNFISLRVLYRFLKEPQYNIYSAGLIGYFRDDDVSKNLFAEEETDEAMGYGIVGGFEYFFKGLPNIGWNVEVDYIYIDFEKKWWEYDYEAFSLIMLGIGVNYYF